LNSTFCGKSVKEGQFKTIQGYEIQIGFSALLCSPCGRYALNTSTVEDILKQEELWLVATVNSIYIVQPPNVVNH